MSRYERRGRNQPCDKDCPERGPGCGANCEKWKAYVAERNEEYRRRVEDGENEIATAARKRTNHETLYRKKIYPKNKR